MGPVMENFETCRLCFRINNAEVSKRSVDPALQEFNFFFLLIFDPIVFFHCFFFFERSLLETTLINKFVKEWTDRNR